MSEQEKLETQINLTALTIKKNTDSLCNYIEGIQKENKKLKKEIVDKTIEIAKLKKIIGG